MREAFVLRELAYTADSQWISRTSVAEVALHTAQTERTVTHLLTSLERKGLIEAARGNQGEQMWLLTPQGETEEAR